MKKVDMALWFGIFVRVVVWDLRGEGERTCF